MSFLDLDMGSPMSLETDLKFRVAKRRLAVLAKGRLAGAKLGPRTSRVLVSSYFDMRKHKFQRHGLTLRVRRSDDGGIVQTIKSVMTRSFARGVNGRPILIGQRPTSADQKIALLLTSPARRRGII